MSGATPFRAVLVGADSLLIECGEILASKGHEIVAVVAGSEKVRRWAIEQGHAVVAGDRPSPEWVPELSAAPFDWLFSITHLALIDDVVLDLPAQGAINFHDGPLPRYAGLNTPAWALMRGEETYGISWHAITSGVDTGDLYAQRLFEVADDETSLSLNMRNFEAAIETFGELIDDLAAGTASTTAQDPTAERFEFRRNDRPPAMGVLDWATAADDLERMVRALHVGPYPNPIGTAKVVNGDAVVQVSTAELADDPGAVAPGTVVAVTDEAIVVACEPGALALTGFTTASGGPLEVADAAAVLGTAPGARLEVLTADDRERLTVLGRRLAAGERHHLARLEALHAVELPWATTPSAEHTPREATAEVAVPDAVAGDEATVVAAFAALLARLSGNRRFHLALVDAALDVDPIAARLVAPAVALEVAVDESADFAAVRESLGDELAEARRRPPYARELIARTPDLAGRAELAQGLLPLGVRIGVDGPPVPGTVLELVRSDGWRVRYDEALVAPADAALFVACLEAVLGDVAARPTVAVAEIDLLGPALRHRVLEEWNDTAVDVPGDVAVHHLVEAQADRTPDVAAVVFEDEPITYRALDERANRLAHRLRELGVGPDGLVGVHVERGLDLVVAALGVQKAGGAYVPLDPTYPSDRLQHMIADSGCAVVLTNAEAGPPPVPAGSTAVVVDLDADRATIDAQPSTRPEVTVRGSDLAYCIYTSGSTGLPKGVLVEHRNAVNFFAGMDPVVAPELPATWFAVTSLSFDISVLELLYTLTRGFTVVVYRDRDREEDGTAGSSATFVEQHRSTPMDFSLFYFSGDEAESSGSDKYRLLLEGAKWADERGFCAVWTPERHFHAFGGLYPHPAVTGAAVAAVTKNVSIRAGSVVMPLHHPIRVAEQWSVVDNLSNGRVAISIASGWQPNDFVLMPENYANAKQAMFDGIEVVKQLWRGEQVTFTGPVGEFQVSTLPRPVQEELPVWVTTAGNPDTYIQAGRIGANVLTHLLGQSVEQLAPKIEAYRKARAEAGFDPDAGIVSLMLHSFVADDEDQVRELVREPLKQYLGTSFSLLKEYAWSFPAFQRPEGDARGSGVDSLADDDFKNLSDEDLDAVLEFAFLRYFESSGLFGTPESCQPMVDRLKGIGVNEIACLIDFGVATDTVLESLPHLETVLQLSNAGVVEAPAPAEGGALDQSVAAQLRRHQVTHLQCTPSMARMLTMQDDSRAALATVDHLFIGGEAFPVALAKDLEALSANGTVTNMYGPTETTIWSTTWPLEGELDTIPIGTPIANTQIYVLDQNLQPLPPGVQGELWIGGLGVVRGYHERPELTAERFVPDPFAGGSARMYRTGDLARWRQRDDGSGLLEFLGRIDHQVKIRGYRIELGEIEAQLGKDPGVLECVAVVQEESAGDQQLVAYVSPKDGATIEPSVVKDRLRQHLPEVMVPGHVVVLDVLPHTPNGKIDRNALPSLAEVRSSRAATAPPAEAGSDLERQVLAIWEDTLGTTGIGIDDNFFDIGGHSLLLVRMQRRIRDGLERNVPLTDLYRYPTVRSFAQSLTSDVTATVMQSSQDRAARRREAMSRRRTRA